MKIKITNIKKAIKQCYQMIEPYRETCFNAIPISEHTCLDFEAHYPLLLSYAHKQGIEAFISENKYSLTKEQLEALREHYNAYIAFLTLTKIDNKFSFIDYKFGRLYIIDVSAYHEESEFPQLLKIERV